MLLATGEEYGAPRHALAYLQPEHVAIEWFRPFEIANAQHDVTQALDGECAGLHGHWCPPTRKHWASQSGSSPARQDHLRHSILRVMAGLGRKDRGWRTTR